MDKRKVGILTFSDGRDFAHKLQYDMNMQFQEPPCQRAGSHGEIEPVPCDLCGRPSWPAVRAASSRRGRRVHHPQLRHMGLPPLHLDRHRVRSRPVPVLLQYQPAVSRPRSDARRRGFARTRLACSTLAYRATSRTPAPSSG